MANVSELVGGRESEILAALGIDLDASGAHVRCPYPDHEDVHPSYRWIAGEAKAVCTCRSKHGIIDVVMNAKGLDFAGAARWIEDVLSVGKTGGFDRLRKAAERKPERGAFSAPDKLLSPPSDRNAPDLPRTYLAARLGVAPSEVVMPETHKAGWSRLPLYIRSGKKDFQNSGDDFRTLGDFPCAVFEVLKPNAPRLAHRIFLNADGSGKLSIEADGKKIDPKRLSSTNGDDASGYAAIFGSAEAAHVIACEGIEDGAAVAFAFASEVDAGTVAVFAAYSAASLGTVAPRRSTERFTVAGQADIAGMKAAHSCATRAASSSGAVYLASPSSDGADWLETLLADGAEAVRSAILDAAAFVQSDRVKAPPAPKPEGGYLDERAEKKRYILQIGSDYEIAHELLAMMPSIYGQVVYSMGKDCFYRYTGIRWVPIQTKSIRQQIGMEFDGAIVENASGKESMVKISKSRIDSIFACACEISFEAVSGGVKKGDYLHLSKEDQRRIGTDYFDLENMAKGVNCRNGFVKFDGAGNPTLVPHHPDHRCRSVIDAEWTPERPFSLEWLEGSLLDKLLFGAFKGDASGGEKIRFLQELAGVVVAGYGTRMKKPAFVILWGSTAENGKSQMINLMKKLTPADATSSILPSKFNDEKYLIGLDGKYLNTCGELSTSDAISSETFKEVITGESVSGRDLYESMQTFKPIAQHIGACNRQIAIKGGYDKGVQRRMIIIEYKRSIPDSEKIADLADVIWESEADLVLAWAIEGARSALGSRLFTIPESSKRILQDWVEGADPVSAWIAEAHDAGSSEIRKRSDVYANFVAWATAEGFAKDKLPAVRNFCERVEESGKIQSCRFNSKRGFKFCKMPKPGGEDDFIPESY